MLPADGVDRNTLAKELAASRLFDGPWYAARNRDVTAAGKDPLEHFIDYGWAEGRWPNRYFDPAHYRLINTDVAEAGVDPLLHYLRDGDREGRRPHPMLDPVWYRSAYAVPDPMTTLGHFITHRGTRAVPCPELFAVPFIHPYRDEPDPVGRYLDDIVASGQEAFPDPQVVRASGLVEANYYLINGADVHEANAEPVDHYCRYGWREKRKPNIYFDPIWYEQTNPDVIRLRVNPLLHYILVGETGDRRPVPFFDPGWYRQEYDVPEGQTALGHYLANRRKQTVSPTPLFDVSWYVTQHRAELGPGRDPFAHFLAVGMTKDVDPSPAFNSARYRQMHLGRPSRAFAKVMRPDQHNPLVHFLRVDYARGLASS
jgi:hypothetical protein